MENSVDVPLKTHPTGSKADPFSQGLLSIVLPTLQRQKTKDRERKPVGQGTPEVQGSRGVNRSALELVRLTKSGGEEKSRPTDHRRRSGETETSRRRPERAEPPMCAGGSSGRYWPIREQVPSSGARSWSLMMRKLAVDVLFASLRRPCNDEAPASH